jgi:5-methylcytosine-specific restriction endonuclease McrA
MDQATLFQRASGMVRERSPRHRHSGCPGHPTDASTTAPRRTLAAVPQPARSRTRSARLSRKRRRKVGARDNDLTDPQWAAILTAWGDACAYCGSDGKGKALQRDTMLPISRGGRYTLENVVPACGSCNASKGNDEITGWLRRTRRDERLFLERYVEKLTALRAQFAKELDEPEPPGD